MPGTGSRHWELGGQRCVCLHPRVLGRTWGLECREDHGRHVPILAGGHTPSTWVDWCPPPNSCSLKTAEMTLFGNRIFAHTVKFVRTKVGPYQSRTRAHREKAL